LVSGHRLVPLLKHSQHIVMEAVNQWLVAQSNLKQAASDFLDACTTLKALALQPLASRYSQETLESALDQIHPHIDSISLVKNQLRESITALNVLRNKSTTRVPINRLPSELLGHIFALTVDPSAYCGGHFGGNRSFMNIQRVCLLWHRIVAETPSFWSHINIELDIFSVAPTIPPSFDRIRRWLNRSHGVPIHLHFQAVSRVRQDVVSALVPILQPRLTDLASLTILGVHTSDLVQALLDLCSSLGTPSPLKNLSLIGTLIRHEKHAISWPLTSLQALEELNLLELRQYASPRFGELVALLSNCPTLHTLRLRCLGIRVSPEQEYPTIHLPCLRLLEVDFFGENEALQLLPLLSPGECELDVRLSVLTANYGILGSHIQPFLARSNVTRLTVQKSLPEYVLQLLLSSTPRLRVLVLQLATSRNLEILGGLRFDPDDDSNPSLSHLECLCLVSGRVKPEAIGQVERVIAERRLRSLVFWSCTFFSSEVNVGDEDKDFMNLPIEPPQSVRERLSERVKRLVICPLPRARFHHGVDLSIQELMT
ncbi:hypothetical protein FS749_012603, partial [Ceratobasidium sp. UAMH 11750]